MALKSQRYNGVSTGTILFAAFSLLLLNLSQAQTQQTNLPTLVITTTDNQPVDSKDDYRTGTLTVLAQGETDGIYNGAIQIKGRGNSTWNFNKKPYRIKLDTKTKLLGMNANAKDWVLLANFADKTLLRNALAFELGKFIGMPFSNSYRLVDVYLNNEFLGNYTLTDQVETAPDRVNLSGGDGSETSEGFFLEQDGFASDATETSWFQTTSKQIRFVIKDPDDEDITQQQKDDIKGYMDQYEGKLFSEDFKDATNGYRPKVDMASLVNWYLASEITGNPDAFWSTYMFKKTNEGKLYYGPLWDFDISFNNDTRIGSSTYRRMSDVAHENKTYIRQYLEDDQFFLALRTRWKQLQTDGLKAHLLSKLTSLKQQINDSQQLNFQKWDILNTIVYLELWARGSYSAETDFLTSYIENHIDWLDREINGPDTKYYYKLENQTNQKALATGSVFEGLTRIVQKDYTSDQSYQWDITNLNNGFFKIKNRSTGKILTAPTGKLQLYLDDDTPGSLYQQWRLTDTEINKYALVNRMTGMSADNRGATGDNDQITQEDKTLGSASQQWRLTALDEKPADALPLYISGLKAVKTANEVRLSWEVYSQKNGQGFEVQRVYADKNKLPVTLGSVPLRDDALGRYTFTDKNPLSGINYYRLKQIDKDGRFEFSRVVAIHIQELDQLTVSPSPATDMVRLTFLAAKEGTGKMEIWNTSGQQVKEAELSIKNGFNSARLDISRLNAGLYLVKLKTGDQMQVQKIIKTP
ncbi:hypothetical protein DYBT9275_03020 [Dyadobacter sp. CECT 9275]|uniref:Por secretion system C-terminal sorting domain-containing protein n=1 Tax=Dyadobacter helix TaxID=2822344 RepID=A0A916N4Z5_9BACT|nr:CotH kinase family protein [Dyadobacter sp. CECT 9275]CAG5002988.1 hypothetical protein DYBT9275_03020 [Dyadobacter sp. CECT 9275]